MIELPQDHEHDTPHKQQGARRSILVSVCVNLVLTALQVTAGLFAGSQALIADGIHSLSDLLADFVVLLASRHSSKAADADHHYGHYRYENAASLVLGGLLLAVGLGMLWSAFVKIEAPQAIPQVHVVALYRQRDTESDRVKAEILRLDVFNPVFPLSLIVHLVFDPILGQRLALDTGLPDGKVSLYGMQGFIGVGLLQGRRLAPDRLLSSVAKQAAQTSDIENTDGHIF